MSVEKIIEEIETYIDEDTPVYKNPSSIELNKLLKTCGPIVRITANERTKNIYVFPSSFLHFQVTKRISEFSKIQGLMATQEQPSYIFTATGEIENSKITLKSSDIYSWSKYNANLRKEIKLRDWSFCDKFLNNSIKDFLKKLKINK